MSFNLIILILLLLSSTSCLPEANAAPLATAPAASPTARPEILSVTPLPTRPIYQPGQLVDYTAQTGDTLPALAVRFNTTVAEIQAANPIIPADATTMPPGMPMKIPIYYQPFWSSPYEMIPDSLFVNGPAQVGFDTSAYINSQPGWLKNYSFFTGEKTEIGGQLIDQVATDYSLSPRLLLAIIEYRAYAITDPKMPEADEAYYLGYANANSKGLYRQLLWLAEFLNNAYYSDRRGTLTEWDLQDGRQERPDPWLNASSVALQYYFSQTLPAAEYTLAISGEGLAKTYRQLFGDPWQNVQPHIPGSLEQPALLLPFPAGQTWAYTGGPHTGWGDGEPYAAIDFAPPANSGGCQVSSEWATAVADGVIARTGEGIAVLDLDGDGDERTGWVIFYLHLATDSIVPAGSKLKAGDPIGHPSCEGGHATGTHVHIARKYNGEWLQADGILAFNLEGWTVQRGSVAYEGKLVKGDRVLRACTCSDQETFVTAGAQ